MSSTTDYFDRLAGRWTDNYGRMGYYRQRLDTVLEWIDAEPRVSSLLDFGCGSGVMMRALLACGRDVTGVDASAAMVQAACAHLGALRASARYELEVIAADDFRGRYLDTTYQGVLCLGVLEYVPNAPFLLERLARVVEPGGFLILSVPNRQSVFRYLETFIHQHPRPFRRLPFLRHLTAPESYLSLQVHQFVCEQLNRIMAAFGATCERVAYQVAPPPLRALDAYPRLGMNMMVRYRKTGGHPNRWRAAPND